MSDLIDRQAIINSLKEYKINGASLIGVNHFEIEGYNNGIDMAITILSEFPLYTTKVQVNVHPCGISGICTSCGGDVYNVDPYCSHCGAKLDWFNGEDK